MAEIDMESVGIRAVLEKPVTCEQLCRAIAALALMSPWGNLWGTDAEAGEKAAEFVTRFVLGEPVSLPAPIPEPPPYFLR